mgnify:FL=1
MFFNCINFNSNISKWNIKNVKDASMMFFGTANFNQDLSQWNMMNLENSKYMFHMSGVKNIPKMV